MPCHLSPIQRFLLSFDPVFEEILTDCSERSSADGTLPGHPGRSKASLKQFVFRIDRLVGGSAVPPFDELDHRVPYKPS